MDKIIAVPSCGTIEYARVREGTPFSPKMYFADEADEEIARLKKKDRLFSKNRRLLVESNKLFIGENKRLKDLLLRYGGHTVVLEDGVSKGMCEFLKHSKNRCNCGFKEAMEE